MSSSVFVTVGSTCFDALVKAVTEERFRNLLGRLGYTGLTIQLGRGEVLPAEGSEVKWYRYKPSLREDMTNASLIISHGGAGCIVESLSLGKPLVVVINEELMNNHQTELARQLYNDDHLLYTTPSGLYDVILNIKDKSFEKFEPNDPSQFGLFLDSVMGHS
ncbi:UDP-N-acetylglucosamine transferase subunit ALG13 homolog [Halichondria panicea]|uniref:UDP-N-acetylglucosamine transferase subunit ALG13 homolog n=1 Tax=Halichondria panicea TaxID=6063 RepID=UPI00312B7DC1